MSHTNIVALFDTRADADATHRSLLDAGFDDAELEVLTDGGYGAGDGYGALIPQLRGWGVPDDEAHVYAEGVRRGGALLVASLTHREPIERAVAIIEGGGAVNLDERAATWRAAGWPGHRVTPDEHVGHTPVEDIPSPETVESRRTLSDAAAAFRETNAEAEPPRPTEAGGIHVPPAPGPGTASPSYAPGSARDVANLRRDGQPPRREDQPPRREET